MEQTPPVSNTGLQQGHMEKLPKILNKSSIGVKAIDKHHIHAYHIYIYTYTYLKHMYLCIYIYTKTYTYMIYMYLSIYIYIQRERERERHIHICRSVFCSIISGVPRQLGWPDVVGSEQSWSSPSRAFHEG